MVGWGRGKTRATGPAGRPVGGSDEAEARAAVAVAAAAPATADQQAVSVLRFAGRSLAHQHER